MVKSWEILNNEKFENINQKTSDGGFIKLSIEL